jgi:hypothetical protein
MDDSERGVRWLGGLFLREVELHAARLPGSPAPRLPAARPPRCPASPPRRKKARGAIAPRARPDNQDWKLKKENHEYARAASGEN